MKRINNILNKQIEGFYQYNIFKIIVYKNQHGCLLHNLSSKIQINSMFDCSIDVLML